MSDPVLDKVLSVLERCEGGNVTEFCRKLGITTSHYYGWVKRGRPPKTATLSKVAAAYGFPLEWFYSDVPDLPERTPPAQAAPDRTDELIAIIKSQQETIRALAGKIS
ncbi:MAG: helix-turn-helix domain-containing protein [Chitinispirillales bacterium]|nr:helix-turn-helix domain-containing protein [Chitinispirillales bacterium]